MASKREAKGFQREEGALGGVCEALARQLNLNPKGLRALFVVLQFSFFPFLIIFYGLACLLFERKQDPHNHPSDMLNQIQNSLQDLDKKITAIEDLSISRKMDHHIEMQRDTPQKARKNS